MIVTLLDVYGEVVSLLDAPDQYHVDMNIPVGGSYFEGPPPENSYLQAGVWIEKPERPTIFCMWNKAEKLWVDPRTIEQVKTAHWEQIKNTREDLLTSPLTTPYGTFDATVEAQKSITDAVLMLQTLAAIGSSQTIDFTLADNTTVNLTTEQMVTVGLMLGARTQATYSISRARRIQIEAATTIAEVEAITWDMP